MKDEILKIVYDPKTGFNETADQLTALMCYREVKAYLRAFGEPYRECELDQIAEWLQSDYLEPIILQAIEQVKKEMK